MKILYAIQGTGNGHISRARDIIPLLQLKCELDILVSGTEAEVQLPYPIKYTFKGLSFVFGKKGGIDLLATYKKSNLKRLYHEIKSLDVDQYDLVINDFEPVSAWACKLQLKECIGLSHQAAIINKKSPKPKKKDLVGAIVLKNYAPVSQEFGFHFEAYDKNIFSPVIRHQIREAKPVDDGHYTVYLPAYSDSRIIKILTNVKEVKWEVFSKHALKAFTEKNVHIYPINNESFIESMVTSTGVLCGAGFETPAEAMFLKKKLLVVPMKGQYEQQCNAAALQQLGITVVKKLKSKNIEKIRHWVNFTKNLSMEYPDITAHVLDEVFLKYHELKNVAQEITLGEATTTLKKFKDLNLGRIMSQISGR